MKTIPNWGPFVLYLCPVHLANWHNLRDKTRVSSILVVHTGWERASGLRQAWKPAAWTLVLSVFIGLLFMNPPRVRKWDSNVSGQWPSRWPWRQETSVNTRETHVLWMLLRLLNHVWKEIPGKPPLLSHKANKHTVPQGIALHCSVKATQLVGTSFSSRIQMSWLSLPFYILWSFTKDTSSLGILISVGLFRLHISQLHLHRHRLVGSWTQIWNSNF